eukprot:60022_1
MNNTIRKPSFLQPKYTNKSILQKWHTESLTKLKPKIKFAILVRVQKLIQVINHEINILFNDTKNNCFRSTINHRIPQFKCSDTLIKSALDSLFKHIDQGFSKHLLHSINSYHFYQLTINNYWNKYKSEWIGNYFCFPFLKDELFKYIETITKGFISIASKYTLITNKRNEYEQNATRELLYFQCLKKIIFADIYINETNKSEPLILNQSYKESDYLSQLLQYLGEQHEQIWNISKVNGKYMRDIAKKWIHNIIQKKRKNYELIVMHKHNNNNNNNNESDDLESVNSGDSINMGCDFSNVALIKMLYGAVIKGKGNNENINQNIVQIVKHMNPH